MSRGDSVEVVREEPNGLLRRVWTWWVDYPRIVLDGYRREQRPSRRHKYRIEWQSSYARVPTGQYGMRSGRENALAVVRSLPMDVVREARAVAMARLALNLPIEAFEDMAPEARARLLVDMHAHLSAGMLR